jgi:hypothetical protein
MIGLRLRSRATIDVDRWLGRAEGFRVDGPGGTVGVVERVLPLADGSGPDRLVVKGRFRRRRLTVAARDVIDVLPGARRVLVVRVPPPRWRTWPPG